MTDWTKPESYNAKTIAWYAMKERLRGVDRIERGGAPITAPPDQWASWFPRTIAPSSSFGTIESFEAPRIRAEWGGRRSGKTERLRNWAVDMASGPDKSVRAKWINGRWWLL